MDYIPPKNIDNDSCVHMKDRASKYRGLLLAFCFVATPILLIVSGVIICKHFNRASVSQAQLALSTADQNVSQIADKQVVVSQAVSEKAKPTVVTVKQKDDLKRIFKRLGINGKSAISILALKQAKALGSLRAGKKLNLIIDYADKTKIGLKKLEYSVDDLNTLIVTAVNSGWSIEIKHFEPTINTRYATATINGSIYLAGKKAGVSYRLMTKLVDAFSGKVSVNKIRNGDNFALFYKEYTVNGKQVRDSEMVAAELIHKGQTHRIVGFNDPHGHTDFYTPDGHSIKPAFTRYPLHFSRIGSRFNLARLHPILGEVRPHFGVDLVAPVGSPIKATSNGKVAFLGDHGGHGKTIIIKHGIYSTLYAHLSRFSGNVCSGGYVRQGDVIGYVGSSGLSTSPHLHYEFHVNGVHKDPLKVKLPLGDMIASEYRSRFFAQSKRMLAQLDLRRKGRGIIAMNF